MMNHFGKRVKAIRLEQGMTKEDFCEDESELSVRQLTRIERGESMPTLAKVEYIASRLGMKIGDLTDKERFILPKRYKELKYLLLHTQTYGNNEKISTRTAYFDEIYGSFFDDLPEEEQLIIEILDSQMDLYVNTNSYGATKLLDEYLAQVLKKNTYTFNDLILLRLYFLYIQANKDNTPLYDIDRHYQTIKNLLAQYLDFPIDQLFLFNRVLISFFGGTEEIINNPYTEEIISTLESSISKSQDLQKTPILNLIKWKHELYKNNNFELASICFQNARIFAELTQDTHLLDKLKAEWKADCEKFLVK